MQNFIKENWFKISVLVAIMLLGVSFLALNYYMLSSASQEKNLTELREDCRQLGKERIDRAQDMAGGDVVATTYDLNKERCVVALVIYLEDEVLDGLSAHHFIMDPISGEEFASYCAHENEFIIPGCGEWDIYNNFYTEFFGYSPEPPRELR